MLRHGCDETLCPSIASDCKPSHLDFQMVMGSGAQGSILHASLVHEYSCCKQVAGSSMFPQDCITSELRYRSDAFQAVNDRPSLKSQSTLALRSKPLTE